MFKFISHQFAILIVILVAFNEVQGHGMMLDPPSRSSRWRTDSSAPTNYNDNALYCGGYGTQWGKNGGKCGYCGDDYAAAKPRANELGGTYGQGVITKSYANTYTAYLGIRVTANHLGYFYFNLCNLDEFGSESDECFDKNLLQLADGSYKQYIGSATGWVNSSVVLPEGLSCSHCVLRWNYRGGNNWGYCDDGRGAMGCGAQENFKGCADISIQAASFRASAIEEEGAVMQSTDDISIDIPES